MMSIPETWTVEPFSQVATYSSGRTPARANGRYWTEGSGAHPWVSISDMTQFGRVTETKETITDLALAEAFRGRVVPAGTLLMSFKLTIGRVATLSVPACHNEAIIAIYPRQSVDQRYLAYYLAQFNYDELQDRAIKGQTLNQDKIDRIPVVLPPRDERVAIADVLDLVRAGIACEANAEVVASRLKAAAMRTLFTCGLRGDAQKESEIGPVPGSWEVSPLEASFRVASGGTPSRTNPAYWTEGSIPWVKTTEVDYRIIVDTEEKITPLGLRESAAKLLPPGTLLLAMYGQGVTRGKVGILGIEAACNQACAALTPTGRRVEPRYLYHFLTYRYEAIRQLAHGGQQQNLNLDIVRSLEVAAPVDVAEQCEIVAILDAIDRKIDLHRRKRALLDELFGSLIQKLMTGEVRVADLDLSVLPNPCEVAT